ncbi:MAG: DinB family protein [Pirellulales bacterium]
MTITFAIPTTRDALLASLAEFDAQATELWRSFAPAEFFARPVDGGWSPAQNVVHLERGTLPVIWGLKLPKWLLKLLFGRARTASRSYEEVRDRYRQVLAAGGGAGPFTPRKKPLPRDPAQAQAKSLDSWQRLIPRLSAATGDWREEDLDRYRMLHPLLGRLTVREMLYFTLYHLSHHTEIVADRQARAVEKLTAAG